MEWDDAIALFAMSQTARGYSPRTIGNRVELARRLGRLLDHKPLRKIAKVDLQRVLARGIAPSSMQRERTDIQAFFRYLNGEGIIRTDPAATIERVKVAKGRPRPYTIAQIEQMLQSGAYHRTRVMILLGYLHGLRAHEIAKIQTSDFNLDTMQLNVIGKGGKERDIPIHAALLVEIPTMPPTGYWFPARGGRPGHINWRSVSDLMTKAKHRAGIADPRLSGHSLRHSFGTLMVRGGTDLRTAQIMLGHASLATTELYVGVDPDRLMLASAALPVPIIPPRSGRRRAA
jgi:site-specific recombinase XerD